MNIRKSTSQLRAVSELTQLIEQLAVDRKVSFIQAATIVRQDSANDALVQRALGARHVCRHGSIASRYMVETWRDAKKMEIAKKWPDLTPEELAQALPYLSLKKRRRAGPSKKSQKVEQALAYKAQGCSYQDIAVRMGVALSTVYRWIDARTGQAVQTAHSGLGTVSTATRRTQTKVKLKPCEKTIEFERTKSLAANLLAKGYSRTIVAHKLKTGISTIYRWFPRSSRGRAAK